MNQVKVGAALNYLIIGINILTALLYTPFMLRCLGQSEYGLYSLVASVIAYLTLLDFGFGSAIVRYTAKIRTTGDKDDEWNLYGMFMSVYLILGVLVAIGGIAIYFNTDRMFDGSMSAEELYQARIMMGLMVGNLAVTFPFSVFGSIISAYEHFVFQRLLTITRMILLTVVLITVLLLGYKAIGLVVVQTIFSIVTLLINAYYCFYILKVRFKFDRFQIPLLKEIAVFSFWNFLGAIVDRIYWGTGQFVLGIYSGTIAVALFSVAISFMNLYMSMSTSFNGILLPRITQMAAQNNRDEDISDLFIKTGRLQFCVLAMILSGFIIFGKSFILLWAGIDYESSYYITVIFFIALLCPLIQNVGITILLARGQQKFRSLVYLAIAIVSLIFQVIVTEKYGAIGCAIVIGLTLFIGQWLIMNIYYELKQNINIRNFWKQILNMAVVPIILTVCGLISLLYIDLNSWKTLLAGVGGYSSIYLVAFYKFSMNDYERYTVIAPIKRLLKILPNEGVCNT